LVKYLKAIAVSIVVALLVLFTEVVFRLPDIPVRAGEETQALVRMWPALIAALVAFVTGLRLFKPAE
jgi:hypothetical protein